MNQPWGDQEARTERNRAAASRPAGRPRGVRVVWVAERGRYGRANARVSCLRGAARGRGAGGSARPWRASSLAMSSGLVATSSHRIGPWQLGQTERSSSRIWVKSHAQGLRTSRTSSLVSNRSSWRGGGAIESSAGGEEDRTRRIGQTSLHLVVRPVGQRLVFSQSWRACWRFACPRGGENRTRAFAARVRSLSHWCSPQNH